MTTSSPPPVARWSKRRVLIVLAVAVALAIGEFAGALSIDWPAGILFMVGAYGIRRGGIWGANLRRAPGRIETAAVPVWGPYAGWAHDRWIVQKLFVAV